MLSGCAAILPQAASHSQDQTNSVPETASLIEPSDKSKNKPGDALPSIPLTRDILFKLLSSEIAYQRGQWQSAYITLLSMAQQTRDARIARRASEVALGAKQGPEALAAIRLWRELAPNSEEAIQYYLSFMIMSDKIAESKPVFAERLREAPAPSRGLLMFQIQRVLARAKDKPAAFGLLNELLAPYPSMLETHLALALGALDNNDAARAEQESRTALTLQPDSELAALTLAQAAPDQDTAAKQLAAFLKTYPKAREVRFAYARILADQKKYDQARTEFESLLITQPEDLNALYALGVLSAQSNDMKKAEAYFTTYLNQLENQPSEKRDPTQVLLILAQIAEERGDSEAALNLLAKVDPSEKQNSLYLSTQIKRAQLIGERGEVAAARKLLHDLNPPDQRQQVQIILVDSQILRNAGKINDAIDVLELGLKRYPSDTDLLYDYAITAEKLNRMDVMEKTLRHIITLAPNNHHAYNALGYSFADRNLRLEEAYTLIEKALKLAPEDPFIMDSMAWVLFRLNRLEEAENILRRTYVMRPDPEIAVHLGEVLWTKGERNDAKKIWREAEIKDPKNEILKSTLTRLKVNL